MLLSPESMWQCPMAWMVCWLSPFFWLKMAAARLRAAGKVAGSVTSHTFTIWLAAYSAWKLRWFSSPRSWGWEEDSLTLS